MRHALATALVLALAVPTLAAEPPLEGWSVSEGARTGAEDRPSRVDRLEGGFALTGARDTTRWQYLSKALVPTPGKAVVLAFEARGAGLTRDPGQNDNAYVGLAFKDASGRRVALHHRPIDGDAWSARRLVVAWPATATAGEVAVFLSKTGRLEVRNVEVEVVAREATFAESFDVLVEAMDAGYSYFALKKTDWAALTKKHREGCLAATSVGAFVEGLRAMLAELDDPHVWIAGPDGKVVGTVGAEPARNFDYPWLAKERLVGVRQIGKVGFAARTKEGHGYLAIGSLQGPDEVFQELERALEGMLDAKGLVIDLRANSGGDERRAQRLVSLLADERRVYARSRFRSGPKHTDLGPPQDRTIEPRPGKKGYAGPIVCLTGRVCMSSGEGFVKMLRALPGVRLVGQPTRGASGNPAPVALPCGVTVSFSRWVDELPSGECVEGKGVAPDVLVEHGPGDPTFDAAVKELAR